MKSENLVWLVASQQTQHDYCNDYISHHCNYLLKLLLGTLIAICSLIRFEKVEWWTSARSETVAVQTLHKVPTRGLQKGLPLARRAARPLHVQNNDRVHICFNYQEFEWRSWVRHDDCLRETMNWQSMVEEYLAKMSCIPLPGTVHPKGSPVWRKVGIRLPPYQSSFPFRLCFKSLKNLRNI